MSKTISSLAVCTSTTAAIVAAPADLKAGLSLRQKPHSDLALWIFFFPFCRWVKRVLQQTLNTTSSSTPSFPVEDSIEALMIWRHLFSPVPVYYQVIYSIWQGVKIFSEVFSREAEMLYYPLPPHPPALTLASEGMGEGWEKRGGDHLPPLANRVHELHSIKCPSYQDPFSDTLAI